MTDPRFPPRASGPDGAPPRSAFVTGAAGFVGHALSERLLRDGWTVTGFDAVTDYYDPALKRARLARLAALPGFRFVEARLETPGALEAALAEARPDTILHLAAQAGVRHSIDAPESYVEANLVGTFRLLEAARAHPPAHLLLASTSSIYGANTKMPYAETDPSDHPLSFYAATKKATEAMAHSYAHLFGLPVTLFRFFTVYGPWGRPDMALFKFTRAAVEGRPIDVYNHGRMRRDFTYIDDLVEVIARLIAAPPPAPSSRAAPPLPGDSLSPAAPWRIVNIGQSRPVALADFIAALEAALGQTIAKRFLPMQPGEVLETWADTALAERLAGRMPVTPLDEGVARFVAWYREFYGP